MNPRSQTRRRSLSYDFDPEISIGWKFLPAMSSENLVNLILVANMMSERQTSPRWRWITHTRNNTLLVRQIVFSHTHNALQGWVTQATQYTITTLTLQRLR